MLAPARLRGEQEPEAVAIAVDHETIFAKSAIHIAHVS